MKQLYVVTGIIDGSRIEITQPYSKRYAKIIADNLRYDVRNKTERLVTNIRIKKAK